jgi:hypothetical protein
MYKTLGFRWLFEVFYPASAFATTDRDEARNPQRFIHVTVGSKCKGRPDNNKQTTKNKKKVNHFDR